MMIPNDWGAIAAAAALGYFWGSVPFGLIFVRLAGHGDIRAIGSGNIGATNVLRTGSKKLALATLACDVLKGIIPVVIAARFGVVEAATAAAIGAPLGHIFPVWLRFKGGKGVATAAGTLLAYAWPVAAIAALTWFVMAALFRYSSLAAVAAAVVAPVYTWIARPQGVEPVAISLVALVIIWRHRENLTRLARGEEDKIGFRKKSA